MRRFPAYSFFFLSFALMCAFWMRVGSPDILPPYPDDFSAELMESSLRSYSLHGDAAVGGFMKAFEKGVHIAAVMHIDGPSVARSEYPYISNFNLQYTLMKPLVNALGIDGALAAGKIILALCMSAVVAGICVFATRNFSFAHGLAVLAVFALSPGLADRATNLYWFTFLFFLPFVAMLSLYRAGPINSRFIGLMALVAFLIMVKSLTGYEYLTNATLGAMLPMVYYEFRQAGKRGYRFLADVTFKSFLIGSAAIAGFAAAMGLHVWKAAQFFGDWSKGLEAFLVPLRYSTVDSVGGIRASAQIDAASMIASFVMTFVINNWHVNLAVALAIIILLIARLLKLKAPEDRAFAEPDRALLIAFVFSGLCSISWFVAASKHSIAHAHINWIAQYLYFLPFAAMLIVSLYKSLKPGRQAPLPSGAGEQA